MPAFKSCDFCTPHITSLNMQVAKYFPCSTYSACFREVLMNNRSISKQRPPHILLLWRAFPTGMSTKYVTVWQNKSLKRTELVQKRTCRNSGISVFKVQLHLQPQQTIKISFSKSLQVITIYLHDEVVSNVSAKKCLEARDFCKKVVWSAWPI